MANDPELLKREARVKALHEQMQKAEEDFNGYNAVFGNEKLSAQVRLDARAKAISAHNERASIAAALQKEQRELFALNQMHMRGVQEEKPSASNKEEPAAPTISKEEKVWNEGYVHDRKKRLLEMYDQLDELEKARQSHPSDNRMTEEIDNHIMDTKRIIKQIKSKMIAEYGAQNANPRDMESNIQRLVKFHRLRRDMLTNGPREIKPTAAPSDRTSTNMTNTKPEKAPSEKPTPYPEFDPYAKERPSNEMTSSPPEKSPTSGLKKGPPAFNPEENLHENPSSEMTSIKPSSAETTAEEAARSLSPVEGLMRAAHYLPGVLVGIEGLKTGRELIDKATRNKNKK